MRFTPLRVGLLALAALGPVVGQSLLDGYRIDACLDRGGSYDYIRDQCDHSANHPLPAMVDPSTSGRDGRWWFTGELACAASAGLAGLFEWQDRRRARSRPVV